MMSCACGRIVIGSGQRRGPSASPQRALIWGVSLDVAQVSITSGSGVQSVPPQCVQAGMSAVCRAWSRIGSHSSGATNTSPQPSQNHTGKGTPKKRWREMHQSHSSPSTQFR